MTVSIKMFSGFLWLCAIVLLWFGGQLLAWGGSPHYLLAALVCACVAWLTRTHNPRALSVYAVFCGATVLWAIWESGLDDWALTARLAMFSVLGLWMLSPPYRQHLGLTPGFTGSRVLWPGLTAGAIAFIAAVPYLDTPPKKRRRNHCLHSASAGSRRRMASLRQHSGWHTLFAAHTDYPGQRQPTKVCASLWSLPPVTILPCYRDAATL